MIGQDWAGLQADGTIRINDPDDLVRLEVAAALIANIAVIPVLVNGAAMPEAASLPNDLKRLTLRHAAEIGSGRGFHTQINELIEGIERIHATTPNVSKTTEAEVTDDQLRSLILEFVQGPSSLRRALLLGVMDGIKEVAAANDISLPEEAVRDFAISFSFIFELDDQELLTGETGANLNPIMATATRSNERDVQYLMQQFTHDQKAARMVLSPVVSAVKDSAKSIGIFLSTENAENIARSMIVGYGIWDVAWPYSSSTSFEIP